MTFGYDGLGRQNKSVAPGGTISRTVFDARGQAVADYAGTDDSGATDADPTGCGGKPHGVPWSASVLRRVPPHVVMPRTTWSSLPSGSSALGSSGCSCGGGGASGQLDSETRWVDTLTSHTTEFEYDWRGRQLHVFPPADDAGRVVYTTTTYDNLDRAIRQERYLEIVTGTDRLLARSDSSS